MPPPDPQMLKSDRERPLHVVTEKPLLGSPPASSYSPPPNTASPTMRSRTRCMRATILALPFLLIILCFHRRFLPYSPSSPGLNLPVAPRLGLIPTKSLPHHLIPRRDNPDRRLIFIGDVHGMFSELRSLVKKIGYNPKTDHLVFTGDLVAKGPDSDKVLEYAESLGASCVRGNWDDRSHPKGWLARCPLILTVDNVRGLGDVLVVHGGLVPGVPLERQDPSMIMNMRSLSKDEKVGRHREGKRHWADAWNRREPGKTVVYGHYAKKGLDLRKWTKGLDSGCVKGGRLSALVVGRGTKKGGEVVSVKCRNMG